MVKRRGLLVLLLFLVFENFAMILAHSFQEKEANPGTFIDDYINFPTLDCVFEPELTNDFTIKKNAVSAQKNVASFGTPIVGDVTGDGKPEILILQSPGTNWEANKTLGNELIYKTRNIAVYNYDGTNLISGPTLTTPYFINMEGPNPFSIARVPGFTNPLVIVAASSSEPNLTYQSRLVAYEFSGGAFVERWISSSRYGQNVPPGTNFLGPGLIGPYQYSSGGAPGLADFDQDGRPEVYIFNEIFDAVTGAKLVDGGSFGQGVSEVFKIGFEMRGGTISLTVAADITPSPGLELAAGNTIYNVTNTAGTWSMTPIQAGFNVNGSLAKDGFTSIADLNNDGKLDVVVTTARDRNVSNSRTVYVWNVDAANAPLLIASTTIADSPLSSPLDNQYESGTGVAFIGDIDGDLSPEIGVTSHRRLNMFRYNNTPTLQNFSAAYPQNTNDRSGYTLITMFDFNQDGEQELVYRDEQKLRIINGGTGANLAEFDVYSATAGEGAIVADLDDDGEAEIVVTDAGFFNPSVLPGFPSDPSAFLTVYETAADPWAPAREIWNQYGYFNVNILGDLSVPQVQLNHAIRASELFPNLDPVNGCFPPNAQPLNSFLVQGTFYNDSGCRTANIPAFDVEIDNSSLFARRSCEPQSLEVNFRLRNNFTAKDIPTDMEISFYKEEADGTLTFLGVKIPAGQIIEQADGWVDFSGIVVNSPLIPVSGDFNLVIIANNTGTVDSPDRLLECNYTNNTSIGVPVLDLPTFSIQSSASELCTPGNQLVLTPITSDNLAVNPTKNWKRLAVGAIPVFQIPTTGPFPVSDPNLAGVTYSIGVDEELTINNLPEGSFSFVFDFVGCNLIEEVTQFSIDVTLTPTPTFSTENLTCFESGDGEIILATTNREAGITYELLTGAGIPVSGVAPVTGALIGNAVFSGLDPGTYKVRYYNSANTTCRGESVDLIITQPTALLIDAVTSTPTTCGVTNNGSIGLTLSGGTAPYTFVSATRGGTAVTLAAPVVSGTSYTFNGLESGTYVLLFRDANGCQISETEAVNTVASPVIDIAVDPDYCVGETITLTPTVTTVGTLAAGVTYTWVVGTTSLAAPSGSVAGGTYTISSVSGITPPTLTLSNVVAASYPITLQVRGTGSCDLDFSKNVLVNPLPNAQFTVQNVLCFGGTGSITLSSGGATGNTYALNTGVTNTTGVFNGLAAGNYSVVVTNSFGCQQKLDYTITQPQELKITAVDSANPTCGATNGEISFDITGGTKDYLVKVNGTVLNSTNFDFSISGNTYLIDKLNPGTYSIEVEDSNQCKVSAANLFTLVNDAGITIVSLPMSDKICEGGVAEFPPLLTVPTGVAPKLTWYFDANTTLPIVSSLSPASDGNIYQITPTGELKVSNLKAGTFKYFLEISGPGICEQVTEATVEVLPAIKATASSTPVICLGDSNGKIQISAPTGGSGVYEFSLNGTTWQSNSLFQGLSAGAYSVYVRDNSGLNGCQLVISDIQIASPTAPIEEKQGVELPVSCGLDNGAIRNVLVTGGWGKFSFEWRKDNPTTGALLSQGTLTGIENLAQGDYFLIVKDDLGCTAVFDYKIIKASDPVYELVDPIDACFGSPILISPIHIAPSPTLPPAAATEIRWYKGPNQTGLIANGPDPSTPAVIYTIDDSDWLNPSLEIKNLPVGTHDFYFYVVCTGKEIKVDVEVFDTPKVVFEADPVSCFGNSDGKIRLISGTISEYTYSINGATPISQAALQAQSFAAGTYSIQVNTPAGCPQIEDVTIDSPSGPLEIELVSKEDPTCNLDNGQIVLRLKGGNPDYKLTRNGVSLTGFDFSKDGIEITIKDLAGGVYQLELTDQKNCTPAKLSVTLTPREVPVFSVKGDEICASDPLTGAPNTAVLTPQVVKLANSTPIYSWYYLNASNAEVKINSGDQVFGGTAVITATGELELTGVPSRSTPYKFLLEVTGNLVCPGPKLEAELKVNFTPEVVFEKTDILCFGELKGKITAKSGILPGYTYTLNKNQTNSTGIFENLAAGVYTVEVSNGTACIQTLQLEIEQPDALTIDDVEFIDPTCGAINGEIVFEVSGGVGPYQIAINNKPLNSTNYTFTQVAGVVTVQNLAPNTYSVVVTDANLCQTTSSNLFVLTNNPGLNIESKPVEKEICEGEVGIITPDLTVPAGVTPTLRWYKDANASQEILSSPTPDPDGIIYQINSQGILSISNLPDGEFTYYLRISGQGICTQITPAKLTVVAKPIVAIGVQDVTCFGANDGSVSVTSGHDASYTYTLSNGASNKTGSFTGLAPGLYTMEVENTSGCTLSLDFEIDQPEELTLQKVDFTNPTCDADNGEIRFDIKGGTGDYIILVNGKPLNSSNYSFIQSGSVYQIKNLAPGNYSIEVTDENGCKEIANSLFTLVNEAGVLIAASPVLEDIMLGEEAVLTPDLTIPSGAVFDLKWYFDENATQQIVSSPSPVANGVIYQIDNNGVLSITDLAPGTYTYYYEITGDGICVSITEAIVVVKSPLTADIITKGVTCFGGSEGTISVENIVGGNPPLSFSLDGITWQNSPKFENLPVGNYTVYITDGTIAVGFLTSFNNIVIATTATEIVANTPDILPATCNLPNGAIRNLVISGGTGTYSFEWRKDNQTTGAIQSTGSLTGIEGVFPGTYFIIVTDSNGCKAVFEFEINELPDPEYELIPPIDVCIGEEVNVKPIFLAPTPSQPTSPTEIRWYKEAGQVGLISNGPDPVNPAIVYSIEVTDWLNPELIVRNLPVGTHDFYFYVVCTGQEIKVDVSVYDLPKMVFETNPVTCFGDSNGKIKAVSGALPNYTYQLDGGAPITLQALESLNLSAGNYSLEVLTPAGCAQQLSLTIDGPSGPLSISDVTTVDPGCGADNGRIRARVSGGWPPYKIDLTKNGTILITKTQAVADIAFDNLAVGDYEIKITDEKGCIVDSGVIKLVDGPTQILIDNQIECEGNIVRLKPTLDPSAATYSIQWFLDAALSQPIISSTSPDANGITYQIASDGTLTITGLPYSPSLYRYFATASGPEVCEGFVANPTVRIDQVPTLTAAIVAEKCFGEGGTIQINATGGLGGYEYSIDGVTYQSSNTFNLAQGTYSVSVRTGQGCISTLSNLVITGPSAPITLENQTSTDATCLQADGQVSFGLKGGYGNYQVDIYAGSILLGSQAASAAGQVTFNGLRAGTYDFVVRDSGGCEVRFNGLFEIKNIPTPITVSDDLICEGESAVLIPTVPAVVPGAAFTWYFDEQATQPIPISNSGNITYSITSDGRLTITGLVASNSPYQYYVVASGDEVCKGSPQKATVSVIELPNLRVSNPSIVCDPTGTVDLTDYIQGFNPAVYDYNVVSPQGTILRLEDLSSVNLSGDYRVSSSVKGTGCWNQPQRILVVIADVLLEAEFNYLVDFGGGNIFQNQDIPLGEDVYFNDISRGNAVKWTWDFGNGASSTEQNPVYNYSEVGMYTIKLRVLDSIGCESIFEKVVNVIDDYKVIVPNAFTPQGVKNQYFKPEFRGMNNIEFYIFNTWGELIYQTKSLEDRGWDGTHNGKDAPNGNYVYRARFTSRGGEVIEKTGVFILIR